MASVDSAAPSTGHRTTRRAGAILAAAVCVGGVAAAGPSTASAAPAKANPYAPFIRQWSGHDRYMTVSTKGVGVEHLSDGCCTKDVQITYQLSKVHHVPGGRPVATLTITAIKVYPHGSKGHLKVGQHGTATSRRGVFDDTLIGNTFCSKGAAAGACGA